MTDSQDIEKLNQTIDQRDGEELDLAAIDGLLKERIDGLSGDGLVRQFPSGQSNLTYQIVYGDRRLVLRRPPFGTKPKSGHSMIREFRVMNALRPVFPAVPVTYFHMDDEESPLGAEFYVMEQVEGRKLGRDLPPEWSFSNEDGRQLGLTFMDRLIDLHKVDYTAIGLGDFGRPEGYVERQILGWNSRYEKAHTPDVDAFEDVRTWLAENRPETEVGHCIVHGDYRLDNVIVDENDPQTIKAVLDWEISALGDPLMDLGNTLAYWIQDSDPEPVRMMRMQPCNAPGMPTREELVAYYGEKMGLDVSHFHFYLASGVFRLAVILQQIYYRYYHGQTQNKHFARFAAQVNLLGNHARALIEAG